jgi:ATP-dependent Lon protease
MNAEETESPKSKRRLNVPEGAMVIIPLRNRVLFPSMIMPVMVRRPERLHAVEETVRGQELAHFRHQRRNRIDHHHIH